MPSPGTKDFRLTRGNVTPVGLAMECVGGGPVEGVRPIEFKAEFVKNQQDLFTVVNSSIVCLFITFSLSMRHIVRFLNATTGVELFGSSEEVLKCGERVNNLIRLFNLREGLNKAEDTLPLRFLNEPLKEGPSRGRTVDLKSMLEEYYFIRGWDQEGIPEPEKLKELDLIDEQGGINV